MITAVVAAAFDRESERVIDGMRDALLGSGLRGRLPGGRPHMTLSAARVPRPDEVITVAEQAAGRHHPFPVTLSEWGTFPRVVWLGPTRTRPLTLLHRDVWQSMIAAGWPPAFGTQSDPATWTPHCTLVRGALAAAPPDGPVHARVRVAGLLVLVVGAGPAAYVALDA